MTGAPSGMSGPRGGPATRFGPYALVRELGRGGMGAVFHARDPATGRDVALKTLLRPADEVARERFRREADALAALDHPGVVKVHATGEADGRPYIVCELIEGARPFDAAADGLPLEARVGLVRDACRALGHAHARGVVHRDVKPDNLLVDAAGRLRVTDFGLAALEDRERLTRTGMFVGTPWTMAPEQVAGSGRVGPAADVWALGVVLYRALTGGMPFEGESLTELVARICEANPVLPHQRRRADDAAHPPPAQVRASLEAVCMRALQRDPAARWSDGDAMADALGAALRGERVAGPRRALPLRAALMGLALVASGAVVAAAALYEPAVEAPAAPSPAAPPPAPVPPTPPPIAPPAAEAASPTAAERRSPAASSPAADGDESVLVAVLRTQADAGVSEAMVAIGRAYHTGGGAPRDDAKARRWFRKAADAGDTDGMYELAEMLIKGQGGPPEVSRAMQLLRQAGGEGCAKSAALLARALRDGLETDGVAVDVEGAIRWFGRAIELARAEGRTEREADWTAELGEALALRDAPGDAAEALRLLEAAEARGSARARLRLAEWLLEGERAPRDVARARALLEAVRREAPDFDPPRLNELRRRARGS